MHLALLLLAAASLPAGVDRLQPASAAAVVAGARDCAAAVAANDATAMSGWQETPPILARTDGRTFARDNVVATLSVSPRHPAHGACWVEAQLAEGVRASGIVDTLATETNARVQRAAGHVLLHLPAGPRARHEMIVVDGAQKDGKSFVFFRIVFVKGT